jgi:hypothetical protein
MEKTLTEKQKAKESHHQSTANEKKTMVTKMMQ